MNDLDFQTKMFLAENEQTFSIFAIKVRDLRSWNLNSKSLFLEGSSVRDQQKGGFEVDVV